MGGWKTSPAQLDGYVMYIDKSCAGVKDGTVASLCSVLTSGLVAGSGILKFRR